MPSEKPYRLTGGVFFLLISQGLKKKGKTGIACLSALKDIFDKSDNFVEGSTKNSNIAQYKKCNLDNSLFLPFENEELQEAFRNRLEQNYGSVLAEMKVFTEEFISPKDYSWLASAIDDILRGDSDAAKSQFHILADGGTVSYQQLLDMDEVEIEPFLTGIWGFILTERPHNSVGAETVRALTREPETKGNPWKFVSDVGKSLQKKAVPMNPDATKQIQIAFAAPDAKTVPKLTPDGKIYLLAGYEADEENEFEEYFNRLKKHYNKITTLLYADTPQPFYDFYVCNSIYRDDAGKNKKRIDIDNVAVDELLKYSNYILLSGNGGLGKSMMMRHLLLDSVNRYDEVSLLPIFLELRSYAENSIPLPDYAFKVFYNCGGSKSRADFTEMLKSGKVLLLCDGLDEVQSDKRLRFQQELEKFAIAYPESAIVVSSRPFGPFGSHASMRRFTVFYLKPFSLQQALTLVEKLKFHEDKPEIKQKFIAALEKSYYRSHQSFAENPLLLTIMMMMYAQIGDVPSKMHLFYNEAFQVLARKHDATKGYRRALSTSLDVEEFKEVFSAFCAQTYKEEKYELTDEEMETHYRNLKAIRDGKVHFSYESFAKDLTSNLCLMYYESLKYHFVHRSFQEYFCAVYLSKRLDKNLYALANAFFESKNRNYFYSDKAFDMLYDMIPERIEENVFIPFLAGIFEECDHKEVYKTFLINFYPDFYYDYGEVAAGFPNEARSFLYNFIVKTAKINYMFNDSEFPYESEFVIETYVKLDEDWLINNNCTDDSIVAEGDVDPDYFFEYDTPEEVGYNLSFFTEKVLNSPEKYPEFAKRLLSDDFAIKKEYRAVREYYEALLKRHGQPQENIFDLL